MKKKRGGGHVFPDSLPARSAKRLCQKPQLLLGYPHRTAYFLGTSSCPHPLRLQVWGNALRLPCQSFSVLLPSLNPDLYKQPFVKLPSSN